MATLITETGEIFVQESVIGVPGASSLNDVSLEAILSETFTTTPILRGWVIGFNWTWSAVNFNMQ